MNPHHTNCLNRMCHQFVLQIKLALFDRLVAQCRRQRRPLCRKSVSTGQCVEEIQKCVADAWISVKQWRICQMGHRHQRSWSTLDERNCGATSKIKETVLDILFVGKPWLAVGYGNQFAQNTELSAHMQIERPLELILKHQGKQQWHKNKRTGVPKHLHLKLIIALYFT